MRLALNTLMWHAEPFETVLEAARELAILDLDLGALPHGTGHLSLPAGDDLPERCRSLAAARVVAVTADHHGLSATDPDERALGVAYTLEAIRAAELLGATVVGTSLGDVGEGRTWDEAADSAGEGLREVMARAPETVRLAVEIHVSDVCNSLDKAEHFIGAVGHERLGVAFDTSLLHHNGITHAEAFARLGDRLVHVHLRGATDDTFFAIPGRDDVDFAGFFEHLRGVGYSGALSLELYEVPERYGISTLQALRECVPYLAGCL